MKKILSIFSVLALVAVQAQGISFQDTTFKDILAKAKKENKLVFLDAFASWCGPCKLMEKNVFPETAVSSYYNDNFINAHFDMEKGEGRELAQKYGVRSYPSFLFLNGDGELVFRGMGYMSSEDFVKMGQEANNPFNKKGSAKEQFAKGESDPEFLRNAVKLNANTDPEFAKKVSERYFQVKKDPAFSQEEVSMLLYFLKSSDDPNYKVFKNSKSEIIKVIPEKLYNQFDAQLKVANALEKAVNQQTKEIDEQAFMKEALKSVSQQEAEQTLARYQLNYYAALQKFPEFAKTAVKFYKNGDGFEASELLPAAVVFSQKITDPQLLKNAVVWAEKSVMQGETAENTYVLAKLYAATGNKTAAKSFAETALRLSGNTGGDAAVIQKLIDELK